MGETNAQSQGIEDTIVSTPEGAHQAIPDDMVVRGVAVATSQRRETSYSIMPSKENIAAFKKFVEEATERETLRRKTWGEV